MKNLSENVKLVCVLTITLLLQESVMVPSPHLEDKQISFFIFLIEFIEGYFCFPHASPPQYIINFHLTHVGEK